MMAENLKGSFRYNGACAAALACAGQGEDAAKLDESEKARLRKQALDWLRADLARWTKQLHSGDSAELQSTLRRWQMDPDLVSLRDAAALAKLPASESGALTRLWADVAALLKKAEEKPK